MTPKTKKLLSALAVTVATAAIGTLNAYVVRLPTELQAGALAVIAGIAHFVAAWGTADETEAKVLQGVVDAVNREPT